MHRCLWIISVALVAGAVLGLPAAQGQAQRVVNVFNWSDYIDPEVLKDFTEETGIAVRYDTFDSNEVVEARLLAGRSGYDVVVPTANFLERQIKAGIFQPLDKSKIPNLKHVWPEIAKRLEPYDPGNRFAVNYMWGTIGIGYNVTKARERLKPGETIDSWDWIFKPENLARFRDCGVDMLDSADDILAAALKYLGADPNSRDSKELGKAAELVAKIRPNIRKFHSSEYLNALATGEICLAVGYSGDIKQSQRRAKEANSGVAITYVIPKEGAEMWFDNLSVPKDARNVDEAHAFIDYLMRPEVAAKNSNFVGYANGNLASQKLIDPAVLGDPTIYPDEATMRSLYTLRAKDQRTQRTVNRLWTRIKTGT